MNATILVPLDRSGFAETALPYALGIAVEHGATLHLAIVHGIPAMELSEPVPDRLFAEAEAELRLEETSYLDELAGRLREKIGAAVYTHVLDGIVVPALRDFIESQGIDLVVMSTHGLGGIRRAWLGSVTDALLRRSPVPILLVRPPEPAEASATTAEGPPVVEPRPLRNLLAAVDGSKNAEEATRQAAAQLARHDARCTLLRIVKPRLNLVSPYLPHTVALNREDLERKEDDATKYVGDFAQRLRRDGLRVGKRIVVDFHEAEAILREAADTGADLISVGTHGRGALSRMVLGSVADKVIRGALGPVFVLPMRAIAPELAEEHAEAAAAAGQIII